MPTPEDINTVDAPVIVDDVDAVAVTDPSAANTQPSQTLTNPSTITPLSIPEIDKPSV